MKNAPAHFIILTGTFSIGTHCWEIQTSNLAVDCEE
jgi:hypothetical protein